ncbi:uncharacterized protein BDCG_06340 [Blastomyces dermatitidis ER-3]|uniref:Uncharacterized protein n=1 Tax=Ajellomyces dermatitidis (strain ER-3 / ATCC MYA-2586) TaxID=559297 RepID=A0ABP2F2Z2_AJEDR|nr:uncharacterized protein BDCG_06340 [Blastomyces dermatitidis ER-3]EEQ91220.1 hypothetical protein BDCG_06340 [Blastomyces dermatitidis ER-3]EQL32033.1 hypothetical protein BDFG_05754 [Blastomyces dermatitidis ATCC 26199]
MTFSESSMPGTFFLDSPIPPKLDLASATSRFYHSPHTHPAASSLCHSVGPEHQGSRKRARYGYGGVMRGDGSPSLEDGSVTFATTTAATMRSLSPVVGGGRDGTVNSRKRGRRESLLSESPDSDNNKNNATGGGWGSTVVKIVGGVAGKVWDFCWSGPFSGFYAGGGKGYHMGSEPQQPPAPSLPPSQVVEEPNAWQNVCEKDDVFSSSGGRKDGGIATVPGHFPVDSFHKNPRVLHNDHDELQGNWILVRNAKKSKDVQEDDMSPSSTHHSSAHKIARKTNSVTPRRVAVGRLARKQPFLTPARPSSPSSSSNHHPHYHQLSSSHGKTSYEPAKSSSPTKYGSSPASIEAQRLAARAKRREREEDASIRRLNQQLKAMIKEGKEALGTNIEIEDDGMDMEDWD